MTVTKDKLDKQLTFKKVAFTPNGWEDFQYWQKEDPKKFEKLLLLIDAAKQSLHTGIGKPEKLSGNLKGYYSRRIDTTNRLVYKTKGDDLVIVMARFHY